MPDRSGQLPRRGSDSKRPTQSGRPELGAIMVLYAIILSVLLSLVGIAVNLGFLRLIRTELQVAADAAAHAGAASLCSSRACYEEARQAALAVLKQHVVHGMMGASPIDLDPGGGPVWEQAGLRVTLERGRALPGDPFLSFEGDWQRDNPGIPVHVAANAVRVRIERQSLFLKLAPHTKGGYTLAREVTATKGETDPVCVAPFAIPVCALLREQALPGGGTTAELDSGGLCAADRIFTRSMRWSSFYSHDPDTGADARTLVEPVPEFFWQPSVVPGVQRSEPTCSWNSPRFGESGDHFGVVGLPESSAETFVGGSGYQEGGGEARIREILRRSSRPCVPARIGERFMILEEGLTETATDTALWRQISDGYLTGDSQHPPFSQVFPGITVKTKVGMPGTTPDVVPGYPSSGFDECGAQPRAARGWGACNSRRYVYNGVRNGQRPFPTCFGNGFHPAQQPDGTVGSAVDIDTPVWSVAIPVIAEAGPDARMCKGLSRDGIGPAAFDERPEPASFDYVVIGFVQAHILDTDVGWRAPVQPWNCDPSEWGGPNPPNFSDWGFTFQSGCNPPYSSGACAPRCNVIRGRLTCGNAFIPSSSTTGTALPRILG